MSTVTSVEIEIESEAPLSARPRRVWSVHVWALKSSSETPSRCDAIAWFITLSSSSPYSEHAIPVIESESKIVTGIGETVGAGIGTNVGVEIGTLVGGCVVGVEIVGCGFGKADGTCKAIVGAALTLGTAVGAALTLGKAVGAYDGNGVGTDETVGAGIGTALGAAVGAYDGNGVGSGVSASRCRYMPCAIAPSIGSVGREYAPLTATRSTEMRSILVPVCVDGNRVTVNMY